MGSWPYVVLIIGFSNVSTIYPSSIISSPRDNRNISLPPYYRHDVLFYRFVPATNIAEVTLGNNQSINFKDVVMTSCLSWELVRLNFSKGIGQKNVADRCFNKNMDIKFSAHDALIGFLCQGCPIFYIYHVTRLLRRVWRHQRGNQNPYIEEEQTTQWPKEKGQTTIYKTYI